MSNRFREHRVREVNAVSIVRMSDPVVAAYSEPSESRWGYHQFPALSRLPDGRILLMYAHAEDASESHGMPAPAFVSNDGELWEAFEDELQPVRPHFSITELANGGALVLPAGPYYSANVDDLPRPVATANVYGTFYTYRCSELSDDAAQDLEFLNGLRYDADAGSWTKTIVRYDMKDRLAWRREGSTLLPRPFFERASIRHGDELFYPDYRVRFALPDGRIPPKGCTWLMVSSDEGMSFSRRALIAGDPSGHDLHGEPTIAVTAEGNLVCVVRRTDQVQKPMAITWSHDSGYTWSPSRSIFRFGVFPCLLTLSSGPLILSYGRPGVHIAVASDGCGKRWDQVHTIIPGDDGAVQRDSCGYTNLLALGPAKFLITYSDFNAVGPSGGRHKAICTRIVELN